MLKVNEIENKEGMAGLEGKGPVTSGQISI